MIIFRDFSLRRGVKLLFDELQLTINPGQKVGIVGANGCGKSSLFAVLRGELSQDTGTLDLPSKWVIAHVAQETPALELPAVEYVLDGDRELRAIEKQLEEAQAQHDGMKEATLHAHYDAIGGYTAKSRAAQLLYGLGFTPEQQLQPVRAFSGGWRMRLNLAQALMCRSDLLLLDEPTNHLDLDAVLWFEQWLKQYQGTLLLISHDRDFLDNTVDGIAHVENQGIIYYAGDYSSFERQRAAKLALQQAAFEKQQREIAHIQKFVDRFRYKASKARQAQSRLKALERMETISAAHVDSPFYFEFPEPEKMPQLLLSLEEIAIGYQAEKPVLAKINLRILAGVRWGLLGVNGAGKSTFIKLLAGELEPISGVYQRGDGLKIGYFAQHQLEQLDPHATPLLHLQRINPNASEQTIRSFLGGFNFQGEMATSQIEPFSGGEKARLALAAIVWQRPNLLLLDEPTNHLDLEMRHALALALQDYQGALIVVSHDRHLLRTTTDQFVLVAQQRVKMFDGDLDDYRQLLLSTPQPTNNTSSANTATAAPAKKNPQLQREQRKPLQNRLRQLEKEMDKLTTEKTKLEHSLAEPEIYSDPIKAKQLAQQQAQVSSQLAKLEEEWLDVSEQLEGV